MRPGAASSSFSLAPSGVLALTHSLASGSCCGPCHYCPWGSRLHSIPHRPPCTTLLLAIYVPAFLAAVLPDPCVSRSSPERWSWWKACHVYERFVSRVSPCDVALAGLKLSGQAGRPAGRKQVGAEAAVSGQDSFSGKPQVLLSGPSAG